MSDDTGIKQLVEMMAEMSNAVRRLVENQEKLAFEQDRAGKVIAEISAVIRNHADALRMNQSALEVCWKQLGLPFDERPQAN